MMEELVLEDLEAYIACRYNTAVRVIATRFVIGFFCRWINVLVQRYPRGGSNRGGGVPVGGAGGGKVSLIEIDGGGSGGR